MEERQKEGDSPADDWEQLLLDEGVVPLPHVPLQGSTSLTTAPFPEDKIQLDNMGEGIHTNVLLAKHPSSFTASDLMASVSDVLPESVILSAASPFKIQRMSDSSSLLIFSNWAIAKRAYLKMMDHPFLELTPHAALPSTRTSEERGGVRAPRPVTTDLVARRMIAGALGMRAPAQSVDRRREEEGKVQLAKAARLQERKERVQRERALDAMWNS